jgi:hypothetical protein
MYVEITKEEIEYIKEIVEVSCRPEKKDEVLSLAHKMGNSLITYGETNGLTLFEMMAVADVVAETMALSIDKYEKMLEDLCDGCQQ